MTVRRVGPDDVDAAVALVNAEGWAFAPEDFEAMLRLEPDGLFCSIDDGEVVGLTTTASYGTTGWIGNVVVAGDHRGQGRGTALVEAAIDHLREGGAETVGLYALEDSIPLYLRLGFKERGTVVAWTAELDDGGSWDRTADPDRIVEVDARHVADDRSRYLQDILGRDGVRAAVDDDAYAIARPGRVWEVGPVVAGDPARAAELIEGLLASLEGPAEVAFPADNRAAVDLYAHHGFERAYTATTMTLDSGGLYDPSAVYGLLGLEKG